MQNIKCKMKDEIKDFDYTLRTLNLAQF
jgi:hypothetical protein